MATWITNARDWKVGKVTSKTYIKKIKRVNYFNDYQSPECSGFILDDIELTNASEAGASKIRLIDVENGDLVYETTVDTFRKKGIKHEGKHGDFVVLPLQDFKQDHKNFPVEV